MIVFQQPTMRVGNSLHRQVPNNVAIASEVRILPVVRENISEYPGVSDDPPVQQDHTRNQRRRSISQVRQNLVGLVLVGLWFPVQCFVDYCLPFVLSRLGH